jgi:acyl dehydratase
VNLYDHSLFKEEIFFDEFEVGNTFAPLKYRINSADVIEYLKSVDDDNPVFTDNTAAKKAGFAGAILPPFAILNYGFIYQAMRRRPPTGNLNTSCELTFLSPVLHGTELTLNLKYADKYEKRGRKYVRMEAVVDAAGKPVAKARVDLMFPDRPVADRG